MWCQTERKVKKKKWCLKITKRVFRNLKRRPEMYREKESYLLRLTTQFLTCCSLRLMCIYTYE